MHYFCEIFGFTKFCTFFKNNFFTGLLASSGDRPEKGTIGLENVKARVEQTDKIEPFKSRTYGDSGFESGFGIDFSKVSIRKFEKICNIRRLAQSFSKEF